MRRSCKFRLLQQIKDSNFHRPETFNSSKVKNAAIVYKIHNSFVEKKGDSDFQWQCDKKDLLKNKSSLISTSTNLNLLFVDKEEKLDGPIRKFSAGCQVKENNNKCDLATEKNKKQQETLDEKLYQAHSSSNSPVPAIFTMSPDPAKTLTVMTKNNVFSKTKPSLKLKKKEKEKSVLGKDNAIKHYEHIEHKKIFRQKRAIRSSLAYKRNASHKNKGNKNGWDANINFPELPLPIRSTLLKSDSDMTWQMKNMRSLSTDKIEFSRLRDLPLYRLSLEDNVFLRIKHCRGMLK